MRRDRTKRKAEKKIEELDIQPGTDWEEHSRRYWKAKREFVLPDGDREEQPDKMDFFPDSADREKVGRYLQRDLTEAAKRVAQRCDQEDGDDADLDPADTEDTDQR
jgi:hypothetical protein